MKVLLYTHGFMPAIGGVETYARLLAEGLSSSRYMPAGETFTVSVVTATRAEGFQDSALPYSVVRRPRFWKLFHLIREANVVHLAGPCFLPLVIAWLVRKPIIVVHHGYQSICPNGSLVTQPSKTVCPGHFMGREYAQCIRCCAETMGVGGSIRSLLLTFPRRSLCKAAATNISITKHVEARVQLPRSRTIYYGIHTQPPRQSEPSDCNPTHFEFAYVGRLVSEKGLRLYLLAGKALADKGLKFKLNFIGDGAERSGLEQMARDLKLDEFVKFTGTLHGAELERAVSCISAVVMPSICEETAGLAAIEQMMRGRLVIAADIGGLGEVVGEAGLKFTPGDWQSLASCMQTALENPAMGASLGRAARARALELFSLDLMIDKHRALCREVA